ncbi:MAG: integrase, partial [Chloroflexi bacterium]|nr:integrase [Chloroflexota bacterium]
AKGRIERLWGTFQDRLVTELRLASATTLEEANQVLREFLPRFNARFGSGSI